MTHQTQKPVVWVVIGLLAGIALLIIALFVLNDGKGATTATTGESQDTIAETIVNEDADSGGKVSGAAEIVSATEEPADTETSSQPAAPAQPQPANRSAEIMTEDDRSPRLRSLTSNWNTDWSRHTIRYEEILSGGPPRDGIPSIDEPKFIAFEKASAWLADNEPVISLEINGDARAYPLQVLTWHEITNDVVGDVPVAVTFCPLCNSAITFDRRFDGRVLEFGTSGLLRNSDLIMYDRTTESLWQQFTGEGIVGELAGEMLMFIPSSIISYAGFRDAYPDGTVLSRDTGYSRNYGSNPYVGYDTIEQSPFLFDGVPDDRLLPMERVVTVSLDNADIAYPLKILVDVGVIHDNQGGQDLVVFHVPGTASALDARSIADSKDVGATAVFDPNLEGQQLTFQRVDKTFVDDQTGSTWNIVGQASDGPLAGAQLTPIVHADHFWFSWAAFRPNTVIYTAE